MAPSFFIIAILLLQTVTAIDITTCNCTQPEQVGVDPTEPPHCNKPFHKINTKNLNLQFPLNLEILCLEVQLRINRAHYTLSAASGYIHLYSIKDSTFLKDPIFLNLTAAVQSKRLALDYLRRRISIDIKLKHLKNMQAKHIDLSKKH